MITIPKIVRDYIQRTSRHFNARICYEGGSVVSGKIRSLTISKGSCGNYSLQPQSVFSNSVSAAIDNCTDSLAGKKLLVQLGATIDDTDYWFTVATVYASKPSKKGYRTNLEGHGAISAKLGRKISIGTPATVRDLLNTISSATGTNIYIDDSRLAGLEDMALPSDVKYSDYYLRELLRFVSGLGFGYTTETAEGDIVIRTYKYEGGTITSSPSRIRQHPDFFDIARPVGIEISGLNDSQYLCGDLQNVSLTNPLMTAECFNTYINNFIDFRYQPFNIGLTLGDFSLEPGDLISFTDMEGVNHILPCMSITHSYSGGLKTTVSAPTLDSGEDYSRGSTSQEAGIAYNAYVSGNIGSGGGGSFIPSVYPFSITGDYISNGFGWTETGEMYFINFDLTCPTIPSYATGAGGSMAGGNVISYAQCEGTAALGMHGIVPLGSQFVNGVLPVFYHNGTEYLGAGGLAYSVKIDISTNGIMNWTLYLQFTTTYVESNIGNLYTQDTNGSYKLITAGTILPVKTFFLASTEREENI
jgi:hypothetical protein